MSGGAGGGRPTGRELLAALAALCLVLTLVHGDVLFGGRTLVPSTHLNPLDYRQLDQNYGPDRRPPGVWSDHGYLTYVNLHDPGADWWQWEPGAEFLRHGLARGELPWWDPYSGFGTPSMANMTPAHFFPPHLAVVLAGNGAFLRDLYTLGWMLVAAFCTFLVLRRSAVGPAASLFGACAFLLSGALQQNAGSFIGQTVACMPVALLLTVWFFESPDVRRGVGLALGFGAMALASFPPVLLFVFGLAALYALVAALHRTFVPELPPWRSLAGFALGAALGVALVAFYYLPAFAALGDSPQVAEAYQHAGLEKVPPETFLDLLSPVLNAGNKVLADPPMSRPYGPILPYVGIVTLVLALMASAGTARSRTLLLTTVTGAVLVALKLLGLPPVQWLGYLPGLEHIHFSSYLGNLLNLLLAVLAAFGLHALVRGRVAPWRWTVAVAVGVTAVATQWDRGMAAAVLEHRLGFLWLKHWAVLAGLGVAVALVAGWMVFTARRRSGAPRWTVVALLALLVGQGLIHNVYPRPERWNVWRNPPPYVEVLRDSLGDGRVLAVGAPHPGTGIAFDLRAAGSLMAINPPRSFELYRRYASPGARFFMESPSLIPPAPVLDAAAIRVLSVREAFPEWMAAAAQAAPDVLYEDGFVRLLARSAPPRCFFTTQYRVVPTEGALAALAEPRSPSSLLLEAPPSFPSSPRGAPGPVVFEEDGRNRISLQVDAPEPGLVYCADSFAPGWRATIDGAPASILPANYAFRAVEVPAGASRVRFVYRPPGLIPGLAISGAGLLLALGLPWITRRRRNKEPPP